MTFSGIDGCKGGWFIITIFNNKNWDKKVCPEFKDAVEYVKDSALTLIDIPIGLCNSKPGIRQCDIEARKLLGKPRSSSVFPPPVRQALRGKSYEECSSINYKCSGKKLTLQAYSIIPKIKEVDEYFVKHSKIQDKIRETHPEVCFYGLSGEAMKYNKKSNEGKEERLKVLNNVFPLSNKIYEDCLSRYKRKEVARDDILDAFVCAVSSKFAFNNLMSMPKKEQRNSKGIRMEIVYGTSGF